MQLYVGKCIGEATEGRILVDAAGLAGGLQPGTAALYDRALTLHARKSQRAGDL